MVFPERFRVAYIGESEKVYKKKKKKESFRTASTVAVTIPVIEISPCRTNPALSFRPVKTDPRQTTMASSRSTSSLHQSLRTKDALARENTFLRGRLREVEAELREARIRLGENRVWKSEEEEVEARRNPWRTPSPEEGRFPRGASKRSLGEMVAQVVDGGKRRRVGELFDPEKEVGKDIPRMVKIGGVRWEEGIGGVEVALREAGVGFCDGMRWLVGEEELKKRRERGGLSSTVVVRVKGEEVERQLKRAGIWVGGYWCSVKGFVAVQPKRREAGWMKVMDGIKSQVELVTDKLVVKESERVEERRAKGIVFGKEELMRAEGMKGLGEKMDRLEGLVKGLGRELTKMKGREVERWDKGKAVRKEEVIEEEFEKEAKAFFYETKRERKGDGGTDFGRAAKLEKGFRF